MDRQDIQEHQELLVQLAMPIVLVHPLPHLFYLHLYLMDRYPLQLPVI